MSSHSEIPAPVILDLKEYFVLESRITCVVTGDADWSWHHLNHIPKDHRLCNIVPLRLDLNRNLFHGQKDFNHLNPLLRCQTLEEIGREAFWQHAQVARAYGCSRIAYYVANYCRMPLSDRLDFAGRSLYYARHKTHFGIIHFLLRNTILEPLQFEGDKTVAPEVIRRLLQELEALLTMTGEPYEALRLHEHVKATKRPIDRFERAGSMRRSAQTIGMHSGPTKEVIRRLADSVAIIPSDTNQLVNVVHTRSCLYLGEHSKSSYHLAMDDVSEAYEHLLASKLTVVNKNVLIHQKSVKLPIRATPSGIADLSLLRAVTLAVNKPSRWKQLLPEAILVAEHFWRIAGIKLEAPGRGSWKGIIDTFDNSIPATQALATLISDVEAPSLPPKLRALIIQTAKALATKLRR